MRAPSPPAPPRSARAIRCGSFQCVRSGRTSLSYQWSVNGNNQGGNSSSFTLHAELVPAIIALAFMLPIPPARMRPAPWTSTRFRSTCGEYNRPTVGGLTANPSDMERGQTAALHVNGTGSECGGTLNYSWAASRGNGHRQRPERPVQFERRWPSMTAIAAGRNPSRSRVTATVTDSKGGVRQRFHAT